MKFRHRIAAFAVVSMIIIAAGVVVALAPVLSASKDFRRVSVDEVYLMTGVVPAANAAGRLAQVYVTSGRGEDLLAFEAAAVRFEAGLASFEASDSQLDNKMSSDTDYIEAAKAGWADVRSTVADTAAERVSRDDSVARLSGAIGRLEASLQDLTEAEDDKHAAAMELAIIGIARARTSVLVLGALGVVSIIVLSGLATRSVARPLAVLDAAVQRVAAGDLEHEIQGSGTDEIGELAVAFEAMRMSLRQALSSLRDQIEEQATTEDALAESNRELNGLLDSAQDAGEEMGLLTEMGGLLQADLSWSEAYAVTASYGGRLFDGFQGALYLRAEGESGLVRVAEWGDAGLMVERYRSDECWSLRTGRSYWTRCGDTDLPTCEHVHVHSQNACSACVPLVANGEVLGTIVLVGSEASFDSPGSYERGRTMLASFAGGVALAVSNIQLRETLREQSLRDPLTGLYNRRIMEEGLAREIARSAREATPLVVGLVDVDHFKDFNDTYGHEAGDHVLKEVAAHLRDHTRAGDIVCRYGGEEFVLIWAGVDLVSASARAEALRKGVAAASFDFRGVALGEVTLSVGLALLGEHGDTGATLLSAADAALYEAKAEGRDRVVLASMPASGLEPQVLPVEVEVIGVTPGSRSVEREREPTGNGSRTVGTRSMTSRRTAAMATAPSVGSRD